MKLPKADDTAMRPRDLYAIPVEGLERTPWWLFWKPRYRHRRADRWEYYPAIRLNEL